jgi:hypothetical protein
MQGAPNSNAIAVTPTVRVRNQCAHGAEGAEGGESLVDCLNVAAVHNDRF